MVRFLLEHSLALQKRELPFVPPSVEVEEENMTSIAREWMERGRYMDFGRER
jgi:hypothetical protein